MANGKICRANRVSMRPTSSPRNEELKTPSQEQSKGRERNALKGKFHSGFPFPHPAPLIATERDHPVSGGPPQRE